MPTAPDGDCDGDGILNRIDLDDDNDLLPDTLEIALKLDPCVGDTDGDGVEDGYEYQSADRPQQRRLPVAQRASIPYPGKRPYPNPLFKDADVDYDGDGAHAAPTSTSLWKYTYEVNHTATRTLAPLSYSDGTQYSLSRAQRRRRRPRSRRCRSPTYQPPQLFRRLGRTRSGYGYRQPVCQPHRPARPVDVRDLYDMDRDSVVVHHAAPALSPAPRRPTGTSTATATSPTTSATRTPTASRTTTRSHGPMTAGCWNACYSNEAPYPIKYAGTKPSDADSDGDGVLDGADDQDFDGVPNIMELSRNMAGDFAVLGLVDSLRRQRGDLQPRDLAHRGARQPVQPVPAGHGLADVPASPGDRAASTRRSTAQWQPYVLN